VPAAAAATYAVTATIGVGGGPRAVAVDPATNTIYVANNYSDTVSVIDGATNTVTATIAVGAGPEGMVVDPATNTIYVADVRADTVSVIDGATNTVTATIAVGAGPAGMAVDPVTNTVYVANAGDPAVSPTVSVIDEATNTVTATIAASTSPEGVAVDPATNTVYVTNQGTLSNLNGTVSVIDGATNTVTATIGVGFGPFGVAVDPATNTIYVTNWLTGPPSGTVSVIDGATGTVTASIAVGTGPTGVAADPATSTVYVANGSDATVSVIDEATNAVTATVGVGAGAFGPDAVAVDPATHVVYVANGDANTVSVITPASDADLSIATPPNITTDATGPSGTTVTYPLPLVTDPDDATVPAAACTPAPESVFAIGTTTVTCSASDPGDANSPVTTAFTVTVTGAGAELAGLSQAVQGVGPGTSLPDKVSEAQSDLASGDVPAPATPSPPSSARCRPTRATPSPRPPPARSSPTPSASGPCWHADQASPARPAALGNTESNRIPAVTRIRQEARGGQRHSTNRPGQWPIGCYAQRATTRAGDRGRNPRHIRDRHRPARRAPLPSGAAGGVPRSGSGPGRVRRLVPRQHRHDSGTEPGPPGGRAIPGHRTAPRRLRAGHRRGPWLARRDRGREPAAENPRESDGLRLHLGPPPGPRAPPSVRILRPGGGQPGPPVAGRSGHRRAGGRRHRARPVRLGAGGGELLPGHHVRGHGTVRTRRRRAQRRFPRGRQERGQPRMRWWRHAFRSRELRAVWLPYPTRRRMP
jgi:YVTN family beta-propeller protein